jgi:hypothetical protein
MASITITIPDASVPRVLDAMCSVGGYDPTSGLTKAAFARQMVAEYVKRTVRLDELNKAQAAALLAAQAPPEVDVT